jgi:hypothetical protein
MAIASTLKFAEPFKHGKIQFLPGPAYGFEDVDAERYFGPEGMNVASATTDEPTVTITLDEIDIDPETIYGNGIRRGQKVLEG